MRVEYTPEARVRFWDKVQTGRECWEWTASRKPAGYGQISIHGKIRYAHRVAWEIFYEESLPAGVQVLHKCDNPPCVRPSHLFKGTHQDNMDDRESKGRNVAHNSFKTHCQHGHEFSIENTYVHPTSGSRQCLTCRRVYDRHYKTKRTSQ